MLNYISGLTGINFIETSDGYEALLHFSTIDIADELTTGLTSLSYSYTYDENDTVTGYNPYVYVYLDNVEWFDENSELTAGSAGYETLLHEMGHAFGLKHPFDGVINLPSNEDNTSNTLMSYSVSGGPYSTFSPYDVAALNWIYGGDGLGGELGIGSIGGGRYWTGTSDDDTLNAGSGNDMLNGSAGSDSIDGGFGLDTALYSGSLAQYTVSSSSVYDNSSGDVDTLVNVERIKFSDSSVALDIEGNAGTTAKVIGAVLGAESVLNPGYVGAGLEFLDAGGSDEGLIEYALDAVLGTGFSNADEVNLLYQNLLGVAPSPADLDRWVEAITSGQYTQASLALYAAETDFNTDNIGLVGLASSGIAYV